MDQSLTVVLPVHNCERQLRSSVQDILDLAPLVSSPLDIVIVDDGSSDDTYETACELVRRYPQLQVFRQPMQRGLGPALELVRNRLAVDNVIVHDGVSAIDVNELQQVLQEMMSSEAEPTAADSRSSSGRESTGSRRFAAVRALHNRMEEAHRSAASFRWLKLDKPLIPRRRATVLPPLTSGDGMMATPTFDPLTSVSVGIGIGQQS